MKNIIFLLLVFVYSDIYTQVSIMEDLGIMSIYINENYYENSKQIDSIIDKTIDIEKKIGTLEISGNIKTLPIYLKKISFIEELIINNQGGFILRIDASFNSLSEIKYLRIEGKIDYLTDSLCFPNLESLEMVNSNLYVFPKFILKSNKLKYLSLSDDNIHIIPNKISDLDSLKEINLRYNRIRKIPNSIFRIKSLEVLSVYEKNINNLPKSICRSNIKELNITDFIYQNISNKIIKCLKYKNIKIDVIPFASPLSSSSVTSVEKANE